MRPDQRQFGRKPELITADQTIARLVAIAMFVTFAGLLSGCFLVENDGLRVVLAIVAFGSLVVGIAAAEEA